MNRQQLLQDYGPWAVITGASSGIGLSFARALGEAGFDLVLIARREAVLARIAAQLSAEQAIRTRVIAADLSEPDQLARALAGSDDLEIGLYVASAGLGVAGEVVDSDGTAELDMIDLNCRALFAGCQHFARRLAARGRGGMILLSSLVAFQGVARSANYAATKAYVQTLAEGLNRELAPRGVDVLAVAPGPVDTAFAERAGLRMRDMISADLVARASLRALGRRMTVRPGWRNALLQAGLASLPRPIRARILEQVMAGMIAPSAAQETPL